MDTDARAPGDRGGSHAHLQSLRALTGVLSAQADRLTEWSAQTSGFAKPVVDGIGAIARVTESMMALLDRLASELSEQEPDHGDIERFFAAVDERIDERARERARILVRRRDHATCAKCGAALWPAGPA